MLRCVGYCKSWQICLFTLFVVKNLWVNTPPMERIAVLLCFFVILFIYLEKPFAARVFYKDIPLQIVDYIMNKPMGIKQNTVLKTSFGCLFQAILKVDMGLDFLSPMEICVRIIFGAYAYNMMLLRELLNLLQNTTYNPLKRRYDTTHLSIDQVVLSVFLFSLCIIIFINLAIYYFYFALGAVVIECSRLFYKVAVASMMSSESPSQVVNEVLGSLPPLGVFMKRFLFGELLNQIYD